MQVVTKQNLANFTEKLLENDKSIRDELKDEISFIKQSTGISNEKYKNWLYGDNTEFNSHMNQEFAISDKGTRIGKITSFPTKGTIFLKFKSSGFDGNLRLIDKNNKYVFLGIDGETDRMYLDVDLTGFDTSYILFYLIKSPNSQSNTVNITNIALLENVVNPDNVIDALCATNFSAEINVTSNDLSDRVRNLESKYYASSKKPIVMIGDSIAARIGAKFSDTNFDDRSYMSKAVGGETVLDTVGRMGAVPYMVLPTTIPASGSVNIEVISSDFLKTEFDSNANPTYSNGYTSNYSAKGINPTGTIDCSIAGIHGKLKFTRNSSDTDFTATFTRDTNGTEFIMDRPYKVVSEYVDRNSIFLCFMGTNGGWDNRFHTGEPLAAMTKKDFDYLISLYKRIRDYIKPLSNDFLFLGFYMHAGVDHHIDSERIELWNYFEHEMSKEFGQNYFSVREYLRTCGYKDAGITLTQDDINEIIAGKIPYTSTCDDNVHLSDKVAKCVCNKILERLKENGSIESYTKLVIQ